MYDEQVPSRLDQPGYITWKQKSWIDRFSRGVPKEILKDEVTVLCMTIKQASKYMQDLRRYRKR